MSSVEKSLTDAVADGNTAVENQAHLGNAIIIGKTDSENRDPQEMNSMVNKQESQELKLDDVHVSETAGQVYTAEMNTQELVQTEQIQTEPIIENIEKSVTETQIAETATNEQTQTQETSDQRQNNSNSANSNSTNSSNPFSFTDLFHFGSTTDMRIYKFGLFAAVLGGVIPIFQALMFGEIIELFGNFLGQGITPGDPGKPDESSSDLEQEVLDVSLFFILIAILAFLVNFLWAYCLQIITERMMFRWRIRYLKLVLQDLDFRHYDELDSLALPGRIQSDVQTLRKAAGLDFGQLCMGLSQFFFGYTYAFYKGWQLTFVMFAGIPFLTLGIIGLVGGMIGIQKLFQEATEWMHSLAEESLTNLKTVFSLSGQLNCLKTFVSLNDEKRLITRRSLGRLGWMVGTIFGSIYFFNALGFWYGGTILVYYRVENTSEGRPFQGSDILAVYWALIIATFSLITVGPYFGYYAESKPALERYLVLERVKKSEIERKKSQEEFQDMMRKDQDQGQGQGQGQGLEGIEDLNQPQYQNQLNDKSAKAESDNKDSIDKKPFIEFRDVKFNYPSRPNVPVLQGCSFTIYQGQKVSFVGESGSGKSTIIQLLERFYDTNSGDIIVDYGKHIKKHFKDINQEWRSQIGYVSQEPVLFQMSLRENIAIGIDPKKISDEDIWNVCRKAEIDTLIKSLPKGLDTLPGSGGGHLSGGQKQRIAIARALIRKPKILLLDEATSALDYHSEKLVQATLDSIARDNNTTSTPRNNQNINTNSNSNLTIITVAHRLSTVRNSDRIFFLKNGKIAEQGTHEELMRLGENGGYYNLVKIQETRGELDEIRRKETADSFRDLRERSGDLRLGGEGSKQKSATVNLTGSNSKKRSSSKTESQILKQVTGQNVVSPLTDTTNIISPDDSEHIQLEPLDLQGQGQEEIDMLNTSPSKIHSKQHSLNHSLSKKTNSKPMSTSSDSNSNSQDQVQQIQAKLDQEKTTYKRMINKSNQFSYRNDFYRLYLLATVRERLCYPIAFLVQMGTGCLAPLNSLLLAEAMSSLYNPDKEEMRKDITKVAISYLILAVFGWACMGWSQFFLAIPGTAITARIQYLLYESLLSQEVGYFESGFATTAPSALNNLLIQHTYEINNLLGWGISQRCQIFATLVFGLSIAFYASPKLAGVMTCILPPFVGSLYYAKKVQDASWSGRSALEERDEQNQQGGTQGTTQNDRTSGTNDDEDGQGRRRSLRGRGISM